MAANKVLLVDDDPGIIEVLKLYFEKEGYQVSTCMQGDKAIAAFNAFVPDIVILDLMLPGMDGNDICREIRKTSDCPIIMLTARTDTLDKIVGLELGADDYIPKPFEPKEVLARVKAVILPCIQSEQGIHQRTALGERLGIRFLRRIPYSRCPHQAYQREDRESRQRTKLEY